MFASAHFIDLNNSTLLNISVRSRTNSQVRSA
jgi:hypothetical protein